LGIVVEARRIVLDRVLRPEILRAVAYRLCLIQQVLDIANAIVGGAARILVVALDGVDRLINEVAEPKSRFAISRSPWASAQSTPHNPITIAAIHPTLLPMVTNLAPDQSTRHCSAQRAAVPRFAAR